MEQVFYCFALIVLMAVSCAQASVSFDVRMIRFDNPSGDTADGDCCDRTFFCKGNCDTQFTFCLDQVRYPTDTDTAHCSIGRYVTGEFSERDSISFGTNIAGISNPIQTQISGADKIVLKVRIVDIDIWYDDLLDTMYEELRIASVGRGGSAGWTQASLTGRRRSSKTRLTLEYRAYCRSNYYGRNCDVRCVPHDSDSDGHYTCDQDTGQKRCLDGWINPASSCTTVEPCPTHIRCQHGGTCERVRGISTCICMPEYTGTRCETARVCLSRPCRNGAQCSLSGGSYRCTCPARFTGSRCELEIGGPCHSSNCLNSGTCSIAPAGGYSCSCTDGYTGTRCETAVVCLEKPCQNGAQCSLSDDSYTCTCPARFTGSQCELEIGGPCDSSNCLNRGTCSITPAGGYSCNCTYAYTGTRCETAMVCLTKPCQNGAQCSLADDSYKCACPVQFTGSQCELEIGGSCDSSNCLNRGTCSITPAGGYSCSCTEAYTGTRCETAMVCLTKPCQNGAQCSLADDSYKCACSVQFRGSQCELEIGGSCDSSNCLNRGTCSVTPAGGYSCSCTDTYTGPLCEVEILDLCDTEPCLNSGICSTTPEGYSCICADGYTGERCQEDVTCGGECHNGGSCVVSGECLCTPCYTGPRCDTYVCDISICKERNPMCSDEDSGKEQDKHLAWILVSIPLVFACIIMLIVCCVQEYIRKRRDPYIN